ncbi:MAG: CsgG/HfaB family protein [Mongoliitalea sp.]
MLKFPIKAFAYKLSVLLVLLIMGCSPFYYQPLGNRDARLGQETPMKSELLDLPTPKEPIVVAVYKFRDQTGQLKESTVGASFSTAITQGATNILIRALEESGWFVPIERENISNLLNERKIIRSSREQYEGTTNILLPPLLFAGVLLEGGIISYETNVFTGGAGVRYFGADASSQYREDRVSIYLRAVSTSNGKILKTVYTTKSILSQEVTSGFFRFVRFRRLLEAETGFTYNEPREMAINEAVEKAVHSLILEGIVDNLWLPQDENEVNGEHVKSYLAEKEANVQTDYIGRLHRPNYRTSMFLSLAGKGQSYLGDYSTSFMRPGFETSLGIGFSPTLFMETRLGFQEIQIREVLQTTDYYGSLNLMYLTNPTGKLSPYLRGGAGLIYNFGENVGLSNSSVMPFVTTGIGIDYLIGNKVSLISEGYINQLLSDNYDGVVSGSFNDVIWGFKVGLRFHLGK